MSVLQTEKEKHMQMVYKNNVVIAKDGQRNIVVHSKRSVKPLLPFEITNEVLEQWMKRDARIAMTETSYSELFSASVNKASELICVKSFDEIEFSEE